MPISSLKFGTSGLRGLSSELDGPASAVYAAAFGWHLLNSGTAKSGDTILVARDFRASSPSISGICIGALQRLGFSVCDCGPIPTPALAFYGMSRRVASLMVTGSHIPDDRNGIKFYLPDGEIGKSDELEISSIAGQMLAASDLPEAEWGQGNEASREDEALRLFAARNRAVLADVALKGLKVGVYQHSTVARGLLVELLRDFDAEVIPLGFSDKFIPVDTEAVSAGTIEKLKAWAVEHQLDAIVSADGDGDRPLVADESGAPLRGDLLGLLAAEFVGADAVVTPVTSNSGIEAALNCKVLRTKVGSPFVIAAMKEAAAAGAQRILGFEANGGCLLGSDITLNGKVLKALPTRDCFLPILAVLNKAAKSGLALSKIAAFHKLPFALSDRLEDFPAETSAALMSHLRASRANLSAFLAPLGVPASVSDIDGLRVTLLDGGVIHLRPSGNAPEMRCYVEAASETLAQALMKKGLGLISAWEMP